MEPGTSILAEASRVCFRVVGRPEEVRTARRLVAEAGERWDLGEEVVEVLRLVVSEVVTNAVNAVPGGLIEVRVERREGCVVLEVWDEGEVMAGGEVRMPEGEVESGRGLAMVGVLAARWGVEAEPDGRGKRVVVHVGVGRGCFCGG